MNVVDVLPWLALAVVCSMLFRAWRSLPYPDNVGTYESGRRWEPMTMNRTRCKARVRTFSGEKIFYVEDVWYYDGWPMRLFCNDENGRGWKFKWDEEPWELIPWEIG